jgi:hypothetical protein
LAVGSKEGSALDMKPLANENGGNGRIEFLKRKLEEDRAALAEAVAKQAKHKLRDDAKLHAIVGEVLVREAEKYPDFRKKLLLVLAENVKDEKTRRWLAARGWL